jgi:hypothetical protein
MKRKNDLIHGKIDPTFRLVWFIENFPQSKTELFNNPSYQEKFIRN